MGRIKYKVFLCAFCLDQSPDQMTNDGSFEHEIDVSHLATPHVSPNLSHTQISTPNSSPTGDCNGIEINHHPKQQRHNPNSNSLNAQQKDNIDLLSRRDTDRESHNPSYHQQPIQDSNNNIRLFETSPTPSRASRSYLYDLQPAQISQDSNQQQQPPTNEQPNGSSQSYHQQAVAQDSPVEQHKTDGPTTKLSYDVISVREPLLQLLAERQQLQHAQLLQRQILGDHEYIEVYGERGSSCFYEEIAGSTTSSATYDQIGASSNHNYQVLANYYYVANRPNHHNYDRDSDRPNTESLNGDLGQRVGNPYVDGASNCSGRPSIGVSGNESTNLIHASQPSSLRSSLQDKTEDPSQTIPVYSVINKATRRSNAIIRATLDSCRPPQPPPKNILMNIHESTSAIHTYQEASTTSAMRLTHTPAPIASTSSYLGLNQVNHNGEKTADQNQLPLPPPRLSKLSRYTAVNRPLPLPDNFLTIKPSEKDGYLSRDDDIESVGNGYELLTTNFDDDQVDVGYEKIRDPNRHSGGSISSQLCPLQALDNGGYESVQPIYSSPSNVLSEPSYEAIGPTTASEIAAAATARLTAAAAVIEQFLKHDQ